VGRLHARGWTRHSVRHRLLSRRLSRSPSLAACRVRSLRRCDRVGRVSRKFTDRSA
jgi:hypothetical protein